MKKTTLILTGLFLATAFVATATPAQAENLTVGDCQKFSGLCVGVCADGTRYDCEDPRNENQACVGFSYQVPQCVKKQN